MYSLRSTILTASGTFELMRVVAGQCVAPSAIAARPLGIECRADGDCASRCTGGTRKGRVVGVVREQELFFEMASLIAK